MKEANQSRSPAIVVRGLANCESLDFMWQLVASVNSLCSLATVSPAGQQGSGTHQRGRHGRYADRGHMSMSLTAPHQHITSIAVAEQFQGSWTCTLDYSDSTSREHRMYGSDVLCLEFMAEPPCDMETAIWQSPAGAGVARTGPPSAR